MSNHLHRPCARYDHETPENVVHRGPEGLAVELIDWSPKMGLFPEMWNKLQAGAGDRPERFSPPFRYPDPVENLLPVSEALTLTQWWQLTDHQRAAITACFAGKLLPQPLESIHFQWLFDGLSRVTTHQVVRTRIGAGFVQHSGRVNDWRHRPWVMPETIARVLDEFDHGEVPALPANAWGLITHSCLADSKPLDAFVDRYDTERGQDLGTTTLTAALRAYLQQGRELYAALVDAGVPHQDARRVLTFGTSTYIYADYTYPAMAAFLGNRLEHTMEWEINCIAQLMLRELKLKCPPVFSQFLGSWSDKAGVSRTGDDSSEWSPDGKWPLPPTAKVDAPHSYNRLQNPYWVLHPDSMAGGPIRWIPTNGTYPHDIINDAIKPTACGGCGIETEPLDETTNLCPACNKDRR